MELNFELFDARCNVDVLVDFLTRERWRFHVVSDLSGRDVENRIEAPVLGGDLVDSLAYGLIRSDWEQSDVTPVPWGDGT